MRYLSVELLVETNAEVAGAGSGVRERAGVEAAAERPRAALGGFELYPTVQLKAAALLHSIASTQSFFDGNKRTAWLAAEHFLELNGAPLREFPVSHAEAFVLAVATGVFSIEQAAEWFEDARFTARDRVTSAFLCQSVVPRAGTMDAVGIMVTVQGMQRLPGLVDLCVAGEMTARQGEEHKMVTATVEVTHPCRASAEIVVTSNDDELTEIHERMLDGTWNLHPPTVLGLTGTFAPTTPSPRLPGGIRPFHYSIPLRLLVARPGLVGLDVGLNGEYARTHHIEFQV